MDQFAFHLEPGQAPRISFDARMVDEPEAWQFIQLRLGAEHPSAVAVRRARGLPLTLRCQRTVPLASEEPAWFVPSG